MPRVLVIMSTYNGERYIEEQINSIFAQEDVDIDLLVRDDGSTDNTISIIKGFERKIRIIEGNNIGCENSFLSMLDYCVDYDYYAFSDQDDYWERDKVRKEIELISKINGPALAACNLTACDEFLNPINPIFRDEELEKLQFQMKRDVLRNIHGCVLLWNDSLSTILRKTKPQFYVTHDMWVNSVANLVGEVRISKAPLIKYRLHGNNVSGLAQSSGDRIKKAIRVYWGKNHPQRDLIAKELLSNYGQYIDYESVTYITLSRLANYKKRFIDKMCLLKQPLVCDYKRAYVLFWRISILINRY